MSGFGMLECLHTLRASEKSNGSIVQTFDLLRMRRVQSAESAAKGQTNSVTVTKNADIRLRYGCGLTEVTWRLANVPTYGANCGETAVKRDLKAILTAQAEEKARDDVGAS